MLIRYFIAAACISTLFHSMPAVALTLPFGECRAGYWSSNRNLDDKENIPKLTCFANWKPSLWEGARLGMNARVGLSDSTDGSVFSKRLREGFFEIDSNPWTWRIGRQIIAWGRSDRINPTDSLSPRDLTLLVPDDDEQRIGINASLIQYQFENSLSITGVVAQFEENRIPQGALPKKNLIKSEKSKRPEWALKVDHSGGDVDWSISYFDGYNRLPRYWIESLSPSGPVVRSDYERVQTLGADFALAHESWTIRGEFSYSRLKQDCISCAISRREIARTVLGVDRDFWDTANVNVQFFTILRNYDPESISLKNKSIALALNRINSEFAEFEWGMTFRISDKFFNDSLKLELAAIADFTNLSGVFRPRASYSLNDSIKISAGFDYFQGGEQTFFGFRKKNDTFFLEMSMVY